MNKYVVYAKYVTGEYFWTGRFCNFGSPEKSKDVDRAERFVTARDAYDEAGRHGTLLSEWRVGVR